MVKTPVQNKYLLQNRVWGKESNDKIFFKPRAKTKNKIVTQKVFAIHVPEHLSHKPDLVVIIRN